MAKPRLGKRERALRREAFASLSPIKTGRQVDGIVSMGVGNYGRSCLSSPRMGLESPRDNPNKAFHTGSTATRIHSVKAVSVKVDAASVETSRLAANEKHERKFVTNSDARPTVKRGPSPKRYTTSSAPEYDLLNTVRPGVTPENINDGCQKVVGKHRNGTLKLRNV